MKSIKIFIPLLFVALLLTFAYQNLDIVNVTFLFWKINIPFSLTVFISFIFGTISGSLIVVYLRNKKKGKKDMEGTRTYRK